MLNKINVIVCFFLLVLGLNSWGYQEIDQIQKLPLGKVAKDFGWIVYDVDNTLVHPESHFGSVEWAEQVRQIAIDKGLSETDASAYQHTQFGEAQVRVKLSLSTPNQVFIDFYNNGWNQLAVTARGESKSYLLELELARIQFTLKNFLPEFGVRTKLSSSGILYMSGHSKLDGVLELIAEAKNKPQRIIVVDDKDYNLIPFDDYMSKNPNSNIQFETYLYTGYQELVQKIDRRQAYSDLLFLRYFRWQSVSDWMSEMFQFFQSRKSPLSLAMIRLSSELTSQRVVREYSSKCVELLSGRDVIQFRCERVVDFIPAEYDYDDVNYIQKLNFVKYYTLVYNAKYDLYEFSDFIQQWDGFNGEEK